MATLLPGKSAKRKRLSSILGLTIDTGRIEGVVVRRSNGSVTVAQSVNGMLSLNPLTTASELAGREIRNLLDAAGIHERKCVVGVPIGWALTASVDLPDLPPEDAANLLQIEAERAFPCDASTLQIVTVRSPDRAGSVLLIGIPRANLEALERALRAAKLQPVSFSLALSALHPHWETSSRGIISLSIGENTVGLQVVTRHGLVSLRALEGGLELESGRKVLRSDVIARETRITLGQLKPEERDDIRRIRIFGPRDLSRQLADELELKLEAMRLDIDVASRQQHREFGLLVPTETPMTGAFSLAAAVLSGSKSELEFLPPRVGPLERAMRRYASGKLRLALAAAIVALLVPAGMFGWQQWQLYQLRSQWNRISTSVSELEEVQAQIRRFRPWYDENFRSLNVMRQLTLAFPVDGVVSARTVELRGGSRVTCSGQARDNQALLATISKLRELDSVSDLKVTQIRGRSPTQFTFDFRWTEGATQ
jgi:hypothetical protein